MTDGAVTAAVPMEATSPAVAGEKTVREYTHIFNIFPSKCE